MYCISVQFSHSVVSDSLWPQGLQHARPRPVHHQLQEFTQTRVHWVSDAILSSHPLSFPSPPAFNLSQHQGLFKWISSSHQVAKVLEFQLQHQSFQHHHYYLIPEHFCQPIKKSEHWRIDAFELWCWRRLLWVPWTARRSNPSILMEISPEYS